MDTTTDAETITSNVADVSNISLAQLARQRQASAQAAGGATGQRRFNSSI